MKNKNLFIYSTLFITLLLSSCGGKEEVLEHTDINTETNQALDGVNKELDSIEANESVENTEVDNQLSESKVVKLNKVYTSPGGEDEGEFSITLSGNIIENVDVKLIKGSDISSKKTTDFNNAVNKELKGKTVEEAKDISVIGGSSLTTEAFKNVLKDLK